MSSNVLLILKIFKSVRNNKFFLTNAHRCSSLTESSMDYFFSRATERSTSAFSLIQYFVYVLNFPFVPNDFYVCRVSGRCGPKFKFYIKQMLIGTDLFSLNFAIRWESLAVLDTHEIYSTYREFFFLEQLFG